MEAAMGGRGRVTPTSLSRRFGCRAVPVARRPDRPPQAPIRPVRSAHMRKITLHSGTMLASNASNHVPAAHLNAIPTSRPATTKAMKISPCAMPNTLTPISVRGVPRYLKYMPTSRPTQLTASARATSRNQPADGPNIKGACHGRHCARNRRQLLQERRRRLAGAQDQRVALAAGAAQRRDGVARTASCQLKGGMQGDPRTRHADRMADRDGTAVDVDLLADRRPAPSSRPARPRRTPR